MVKRKVPLFSVCLFNLVMISSCIFGVYFFGTIPFLLRPLFHLLLRHQPRVDITDLYHGRDSEKSCIFHCWIRDADKPSFF